MAAIRPNPSLDVNLTQPCKDAPAYKTISVSIPGAEDARLDIRFQRIRDPDYSQVVPKRSAMGPAPIYPVDERNRRFPTHNDARSRAFVPIRGQYHSVTLPSSISFDQRDFENQKTDQVPHYSDGESIQITFKGTHDFALKIFVGGVNAVSGMPPCPEDAARRLEWYQRHDNLQDYVVTKLQKPLNFIMSKHGIIELRSDRPEIPVGEFFFSLQFEVMPVKVERFSIRILTPPSCSSQYIEYNNVQPSVTTLGSIKSVLEGKEGIPVGHQVLWYGKDLSGGTIHASAGCSELTSAIDASLIHCGVQRDHVFESSFSGRVLFKGDFLAMHFKGLAPNYTHEQRPKKQVKGGECKTFEMGPHIEGWTPQQIWKDPIAVGHWDKEKTVLFDVHFLHSSRVDKLPEVPKSWWMMVEKGWNSVKRVWSPKIQGKVERAGGEGIEEQQGEEVDNNGTKSMKHPLITLEGPILRRPFLMVSELEAAESNLASISELPFFE
ncbi:uncharacterized protein PAC_14282 [Phialocephala subalpina]|uniref:Uncharacterized protein n=1 Tax=Phialocephala subalpina TaxID=576137 RepID=A0A1L7XH81_9HELO|nr:uncharacterized protein PAC_14282 [Phialocephala subalpina]